MLPSYLKTTFSGKLGQIYFFPAPLNNKSVQKWKKLKLSQFAWKSSFQVGRKYNKLHSNNQDKHMFTLGGLALLARLDPGLAQLSPSLF